MCSCLFSILRPRASERGQGLLEMIVAMAIIIVGIASVLTLVSAATNATSDSAARLAASNLAREGLEVARNIRDSNWLQSSDWRAGLVGVSNDRTAVPLFDPATANWSLDFRPDSIGSDAQTAVYRLTAAPAENVLVNPPTSAVPPGAAGTPFRRMLELYPICADGSVQIGNNASCGVGSEIGLDVRSSVTWSGRGRVRTITVSEQLYDWR